MIAFLASRFAPYAAILLTAVALFGYGWVKGAGHVQNKLDVQTASLEAAHNLEVQRLAGLKAQTQIVYQERIKFIKQAAQIITKEVPVYVTPSDDAACTIPAGLVSLLNRAAQGSVPESVTPRPIDAASLTLKPGS